MPTTSWGGGKLTSVGFDYAFGHEVVGGFQHVFEDAGGKVIQKVWPPLNTMDFSPYVASLKRDADGLFDVVIGSASVRFSEGLEGQRVDEQMESRRCWNGHGRVASSGPG